MSARRGDRRRRRSPRRSAVRRVGGDGRAHDARALRASRRRRTTTRSRAEQAVKVADTDPKIVARKDGADLRATRCTATVKAEAVRVWEVGYYLNGEKVNLVIVDGETGEATQSWTGPAVDWPMARGKPGQFGHILNAPWVWIPLALVFLAGLWDFRRWRKWVHLDLLVLLAFGISQAYFNAAEIDISVPIVYPLARLPAAAHALDRVPRPRARRLGTARGCARACRSG